MALMKQMPRTHRMAIIIQMLLLAIICFFSPLGTASAEDMTSAAEPAEDKSAVKETIMRIGKGLSLHKQNYLLPLTWGNHDEKLKDAELKFQLSLKQRIFNSNFYLAYTQKSFWRLLDEEDSSPFRETNYNPEVFYNLMPEKNPLGNWGCYLGYEHESNGSKEATSRSWDRLYLAPYYEHGRFRADLKAWYRVREDMKEYDGDPSGDDNPDIEDFYGYGELQLRYEWANHHMASLIGRWNPETGNSGAQVDYSWPGFGKNVFLFVQLWSGYGESLIDYNEYITSFGFGIMLKR